MEKYLSSDKNLAAIIILIGIAAFWIVYALTKWAASAYVLSKKYSNLSVPLTKEEVSFIRIKNEIAGMTCEADYEKCYTFTAGFKKKYGRNDKYKELYANYAGKMVEKFGV